MMSGRMMFASLALVVVVGMCVGARGELLAQAPAGARTDGDAAVAALVAEVRALRTELAAASRNQLRAQMLMGRVGLQEQRLAYLDKQRTDTASQVALQAQLTAGLRAQVQGFENGGCNAMPVEARRDCQANAATLKQQRATGRPRAAAAVSGERTRQRARRRAGPLERVQHAARRTRTNDEVVGNFER